MQNTEKHDRMLHLQTGQISSSLRRRLWRGYVWWEIPSTRRRMRGRRVLSEYVAQWRTATVPTSDQLCYLGVGNYRKPPKATESYRKLPKASLLVTCVD